MPKLEIRDVELNSSQSITIDTKHGILVGGKPINPSISKFNKDHKDINHRDYSITNIKEK